MFQASDTRFEFRLVDDAFGIAVDQPADAATQGGHLSFQADDLIRLADFVAGLAEAAAIFVGHTTRVLQKAFHLIHTLLPGDRRAPPGCCTRRGR
ncbi:hypothetical protein [Mesorhizobium sp. M1406]|uniref:hypothetical protein n=1 Tax=Mesorhizobium sp. M1406 TaxID=2957099 RepID=UPI00333D801E